MFKRIILSSNERPNSAVLLVRSIAQDYFEAVAICASIQKGQATTIFGPHTVYDLTEAGVIAEGKDWIKRQGCTGLTEENIETYPDY